MIKIILTAEQEAKIKEDYKNGITKSKIAQSLNISFFLVNRTIDPTRNEKQLENQRRWWHKRKAKKSDKIILKSHKLTQKEDCSKWVDEYYKPCETGKLIMNDMYRSYEYYCMVEKHEQPIKLTEFREIIKSKNYESVKGKYFTTYCVSRNLPDIESVYCGIQGRREN